MDSVTIQPFLSGQWFKAKFRTESKETGSIQITGTDDGLDVTCSDQEEETHFVDDELTKPCLVKTHGQNITINLSTRGCLTIVNFGTEEPPF